MNQDKYVDFLNDDPDASTGKTNIHTVFPSIHSFEKDQNQCTYVGERFAKRRPEELIAKYEKKIKKHT